MTTKILIGDCRKKLLELADGSVQCVVTSPPYFQLRDYQTGRWEGGDPACEHKRPNARQDHTRGVRLETRGTQGHAAAAASPMLGTCIYCGAERVDEQIGLEASPEFFVETLVGVFREVRRVLRDDGTLWINIGDSYAGGGNGGHRSGPIGASTLEGSRHNQVATREAQNGKRPSFHGHSDRGIADRKGQRRTPPSGLKPKDRLGIPHMLAFALRADGWYWRDEVIWAKTSPMPESVTDRCTKAHEFVFMFSKSPSYYYDQVAIAEPTDSPPSGNKARKNGADRGCPEWNTGNLCGSVPWEGTTRNKRSVWTVTAQPFPEAHFATMPPKLVEPCILAGTSERGCCSACGAPWERVVDETFIPQADVSAEKGVRAVGDQKPMDETSNWDEVPRGTTHRETLGWEAGCECGAAAVPCVVLDPFGGAGTTALVADRLQRDSIIIELNGGYIDMTRRRITKEAPLFARVT